MYLKKLSDGKEYHFTNIEEFSFDKGTGVEGFSFPEMEEQEIIKISGVNFNLNISFKIINSEDDTSNGTNSSPVKTISEQIVYLLNNFITAEIQTMTVGATSSEGYVLNLSELGLKISGIPQRLQIRQRGGEVSMVYASLSFVVHKVEVV